jgi:hypothetical protein
LLRAVLVQEQASRAAREQQFVELQAECARLHIELAETIKLAELQRADLERFKKAYETVRPNHPERVAREQLQLAFERILLALADPANDASLSDRSESSKDDAEAPPADRPAPRKGHGRRRIDLSRLPVERMQVDPPEVLAAGGEGYQHIGDERVGRTIGGGGASYRFGGFGISVVAGISRWFGSPWAENRARVLVGGARKGANVCSRKRGVRSRAHLGPCQGLGTSRRPARARLSPEHLYLPARLLK